MTNTSDLEITDLRNRLAAAEQERDVYREQALTAYREAATARAALLSLQARIARDRLEAGR